MAHLTQIYKLAIPMLLSSIGMIIVNLINLRTLGIAAPQNLYLLALYLPIFYLLIAIFESARVFAVYVYSGNTESNTNKINELLGICLLITVCIGTIMLAFRIAYPYFAKAFSIPIADKEKFLIFCLGMLATGIVSGIYYIFSSILYAQHQQKFAFIINMLTSLTNCVMLYALVAIYHYSLYSLIASTLISSSVFLLLLIAKIKYERLIQFNESCNYKKIWLAWKKCYKLSFPVFISFLITFAGFYGFNQIVSYFGQQALAGFGVALRVQAIIILPAISFGITTAILYNKQSDKQNQLDLLKISMFNILKIYFFLSVFIFLMRNHLTHFLVKDPTTASYTNQYLQYIGLSYLGFGMMLFLLTFFEQIGLGKTALAINILWFAIEISIGGYLSLYFHQIIFLFLTIAVLNTLSIPLSSFLLKKRMML